MSYISELRERDDYIITSRQNGAKFEDIGADLNIGKDMAYSLYHKISYLKTTNYYDFYMAIMEAAHLLNYPNPIASRAFHCLIRKGVVEDIANNGLFLSDFSDKYLLSIPNVGKSFLKMFRMADEIYKRNLENE